MSAEVLRQAFGSTSGVLARISADEFDKPTPCASWKVGDVINHLVGGTTFFAVTAESGVAPAPAEGADHLRGDFKAAYDQGAERAVKAFSAEGAMDKIMRLPYADLPGSVFVFIAAIDTFTHGWDLARATGQSTDLSPGLAAQLLEAAAFIPDKMRGVDGQAPFGPKVQVADSAAAADKLAGFMGRHP